MFWSNFSGPTDRGITPNMVGDDDPVPTREDLKAWLDKQRIGFIAHLASAFSATEFSEHVTLDTQQISDTLEDAMKDSIEGWNKLW